MIHLTIRNLFARKFRLFLTSLAVVLGVGFMAGTFVLTDTLGSVFETLFSDTTKGVDAIVRAPEPFKSSSQRITSTRPPVPDSLVSQVQAVDSVRGAEGNMLGYALVQNKEGKAIQTRAPTFGTSWYREKKSINKSLVRVPEWKGQASRQPDTATEVALDRATATEGNFRIGESVSISFLSVPPQTFTLVGVFEFGGSENGLAGATLAAFTPERAQVLLNRCPGAVGATECPVGAGQWDQIEVVGKAGSSEVAIRDSVRRELRSQGLNYEVITGQQLADEQVASVKKNLSFFNTFLLIFALVALFVGAFIIYNTFSITVAQRTRELGLMRALGASGGQVIGAVTFEALVIGVFSSVLGLLLGIGLVKPLEGLLSAFGLNLPSGPMQILPRTIIVALVAGVLVTLVSAIAPARRAARVAPIAALRDQSLPPSSGRRRYFWGALATLVGLGVMAYGLFGSQGTNAALLVGVSAAVIFLGVAMLSPLLARPAARILMAPSRKITGKLAAQNAARNPRRTASTASALMIGLALVTLIAIFGESAKQTFATAIDEQTKADFVIAPKGFLPFSPEIASSIRSEFRTEFGSPGTVVQYRDAAIAVDGSATSAFGLSNDFQKTSNVEVKNFDRAKFAQGGILISNAVVGTNRCRAAAESKIPVPCRLGSFLPVRFPASGVEAIPVAGVFNDAKAIGYQGDYLISLANWSQRFTDAFDQFVIVLHPDGVSTAAAAKVVNRVAREFGGVKAQNKADFKDSQLAQFDQILGLMYVLLLFSVVIALIGIINALALSIYERTREIGLLRAVGMTRRQLRTVVRNEAVIVSVFGSLLGLVIGIGFGAAIVTALRDQGISFSLPLLQLVIFVILAAIAGVGAGVLPARRAARLDVLKAISSQ